MPKRFAKKGKGVLKTLEKKVNKLTKIVYGDVKLYPQLSASTVTNMVNTNSVDYLLTEVPAVPDGYTQTDAAYVNYRINNVIRQRSLSLSAWFNTIKGSSPNLTSTFRVIIYEIKEVSNSLTNYVVLSSTYNPLTCVLDASLITRPSLMPYNRMIVGAGRPIKIHYDQVFVQGLVDAPTLMGQTMHFKKHIKLDRDQRYVGVDSQNAQMLIGYVQDNPATTDPTTTFQHHSELQFCDLM